jgi:hypothetical protein
MKFRVKESSTIEVAGRRSGIPLAWHAAAFAAHAGRRRPT